MKRKNKPGSQHSVPGWGREVTRGRPGPVHRILNYQECVREPLLNLNKEGLECHFNDEVFLHSTYKTKTRRRDVS